jgi:RimJ/RimL family protein N-acetyltransferase
MGFIFRPMNEADARAIFGWRYEEPYSLYNPDPQDQGFIGWLSDPRNLYYSVATEKGELIGFCCFGADAQVSGGTYPDDGTIDVGLGLRPDLTGKGMGGEFLSAILKFAKREFSPQGFRVTVATFNPRAIRAYEKAGFQPVRTFIRKTDSGQHEFLQMAKKENL